MRRAHEEKNDAESVEIIVSEDADRRAVISNQDDTRTGHEGDWLGRRYPIRDRKPISRQNSRTPTFFPRPPDGGGAGVDTNRCRKSYFENTSTTPQIVWIRKLETTDSLAGPYKWKWRVGGEARGGGGCLCGF
ncbi:hypothetical protein GWI33_016900 [Rhynchophorus ferrugineus]|uniref:Uncharacterized protein n=1 Tax=Rhynchophorus ferrugineus TaxID=354439 RepID=A0A834I2U6_RHYFE|nr:hypothetical protein GWI33_016900 [Rhynchophorus ferrugineus]